MATLENQTILVVGGSSGIGYAVAKISLLSLAEKVIIASSTATRIQEAVQKLQAIISEKKLPGKVTGEVLDASTVDAVKEFVTKVGTIDHLVWTSGDALNVSFPNVDLNQSKDVFDVRYWGAVAAAQAAKIRDGGSVILTSGAVAYKPLKSWSLTAGVAGAISSLTSGLAVDLAPIRVNCVCPGVVVTELWRDLPLDVREAIYKSNAETLLVKHVGTADECAEAYLFLMKCTYITGQRIDVDGGYKLL